MKLHKKIQMIRELINVNIGITYETGIIISFDTISNSLHAIK